MKKQIKKLSLNKKTISNLSEKEMSRQMGGTYWACGISRRYCAGTKNGNTCPGHTCQDTCI